MVDREAYVTEFALRCPSRVVFLGVGPRVRVLVAMFGFTWLLVGWDDEQGGLSLKLGGLSSDDGG